MRYLVIVAFIFSIRAAAQQTSAFDVARKGTLAEMQQLYAKDPSIVNAKDGNGSSMLILACYRGNREIAFFLADHKAEVNYSSGRGTPLMAAVMNGDLEIVKKLLEAKANPDATDTAGKTALIYAAFFNKTEIAKALLTAGANKNLKDGDGKTALDYARFNQNTPLIIELDK